MDGRACRLTVNGEDDRIEVELAPASPAAAGFCALVGRDPGVGACDLFVGLGGHWADLDWTPSLVERFCRATVEGKVSETLWGLFGRPYVVKTVVRIDGSETTHWQRNGVLGALLFLSPSATVLRKTVFRYEPYGVKGNAE